MPALSRRQILHAGALSVGLSSVGLLPYAASAEAAAPAPTPAAKAAPSPSPAAAWRRLREGNARWVRGRLQHPHQTRERRAEVSAGQHPLAVVLSCIDSRVPPEIVFDCGVGDLVVVRTPGQAVDALVTGSVEFAAVELAAPLIVVLGHERCGAIAATIEAIEDHGGTAPGRIQAIVDALLPAYREAVRQPGDLVENMIRVQTQRTARALRTDALLRPLLERDELTVLGGRYDLDTGAVRLLTPAPG